VKSFSFSYLGSFEFRYEGCKRDRCAREPQT